MPQPTNSQALKIFFYLFAFIVLSSLTSCNGVLRQDIVLEESGAGTVTYTMDYSNSMSGMSAFGGAMEAFGNSFANSMKDSLQQDEYDGDTYIENDEDYNSKQEDEDLEAMAIKKDTTFTIAAFLKAHKDSIKDNPYYTKSRLATLTKLGNVKIHEVNDLKGGSFLMEVSTDFKNLKELEAFENAMADLIPKDKTEVASEGNGPKTSIDGFSPELLGLFVAANGTNAYSLTNGTFLKTTTSNTALTKFRNEYESLFGDEPMAIEMIKSFLPQTFEVNIKFPHAKVNYVSDEEAYIKGDFKSVRRTYKFNDLMTGVGNTAMELRFNK